MRVENSDAAAMYARACRAWYGKRALKVVNDQIRHLQKRGDHKGVVIWGEVATQLSLLGIGPKDRHPDSEAHRA